MASRAATPAPLQIDNTQYVTIPLAAALTGYTAKAIRRKIEAGVWIEGREIRRAPDGRILVNVKAYRQWVERGRA
ncbi:MAG: excisionase [Caldimonas sp.]